jgi:hypothetical protein
MRILERGEDEMEEMRPYILNLVPCVPQLSPPIYGASIALRNQFEAQYEKMYQTFMK